MGSLIFSMNNTARPYMLDSLLQSREFEVVILKTQLDTVQQESPSTITYHYQFKRGEMMPNQA